MARGQAEPIAVIILTVAGLAIALLVWSWVNSQAGPVATQALLTQYLAFERSREFATVISSGVNPSNGYLEFVVELYHTVETNRRWFAFILLVYDSNGLLDAQATAALSSALSSRSGALVYLLQPSQEGGFVLNATPVETLVADSNRVILYDGSSLALLSMGALKNVTVVKVPEYLSGIGDPTPEADVDIMIDPTLLPSGSHVYLVTLTMFDNQWYEVTRVMLR